jgi:hypothetical protein
MAIFIARFMRATHFFLVQTVHLDLLPRWKEIGARQRHGNADKFGSCE